MTVKDVIEHLQRLPPDMPIWRTWDESGECWPITTAETLPGEVCKVARVKADKKMEWQTYDGDSDPAAKTVCLFGG